MISDHEAEEMVELATEVCDRVKAWMKKERPDLMGT
jgi:hypothetical protein